jgi:ABC-type multidrug transport system fused ATPase/permease subunit
MMENATTRHRLTGLVRMLLRPYAWQAILVIDLVAFQSIETLILPDLYANIVNNGVVTDDTGYIWRTGGVMLGIVVLIGITAVLSAYWGERVTVWVIADLRAAVYRGVRSFSTHEMKRFGIPSLITRNTNDAEQVGLFINSMLTLLTAGIVTTIGGVIMAIRESAGLSLLLVVVVPLIAVAVAVLVTMMVPLLRLIQARYDRINHVLREHITGVRVVRAFGRTRFELDRFRDVNKDITRISLRSVRIYAVVGPALTAVFSLAGVGVVWFGGRLVTEGTIPIGNLAAFLVYIMQILISIMVATSLITQLPRAMASAERIGQVIDTVPAISDPRQPVVPASADGAVEFRHVTVRYPGGEHPVVRDLAFVSPAGQTTAITGSIGSGKTTLVNLIARFIDPTSGAVLVNGTDVREQSAEQLWSAIGLVPQRPFLFRGTVASNLRLGAPGASDEQLWRALGIAQASDFVASMPGQLDAPIDQGGTNVSTGQRQRLCVARALVRRPRLYLFDDCFSALDVLTEASLRAALDAETDGATTVIVAQRIATIKHADQIIVLDAGSITGIGTHDELLATCAAYREMAASQLGEDIAV